MSAECSPKKRPATSPVSERGQEGHPHPRLFTTYRPLVQLID